MEYSNSSLVTYKRISPNRTSPRNHKIDRITPHVVVGQLSAPAIANLAMFTQYDNMNGASCNYAIGTEGDVALIVEEKDRSWCSSSRENDNRAVTIECASNTSGDYAVNDKVYNKLIELCADICRRNGKEKLLWLGSKEKTLAYNPKPNEACLSAHRWFANKACPGDYLYSRYGNIADAVNLLLGAMPEPDKYVVRLSYGQPETQVNSFNNLDYAKAEADRYPGYSVYVNETGECVYTSDDGGGYTEDEWIAMITPIAVDLGRINEILPSVVLAQTALETGYGKTDLTRKYNIVGMKADLINATWSKYSVWDGTTYTKKTPEYKNGRLVYVDDTFRVYKSFRECLEDYEAFLLHVKNNKGLKYARIKGVTDPAKAVNIIRVGTGTDKKPEGYCTDPDYERKILEIIKKHDLTKYDSAMTRTVKTVVGCMEKYQRQLDADKAAGLDHVYSNSGCSATFAIAVRKGNRKENCATIVNWALRDLKITKSGMYVYGRANGSLSWSSETEAAIRAACDVIHVNGSKSVKQAIKDGTLQAGDIVTFQTMQHTNVYAGNNVWYDAGRGNTEGMADGSPFRTWRCVKTPGNDTIAYIIRVGKTSRNYRVQVGSFETREAAEAKGASVKELTKYTSLYAYVHNKHKTSNGLDCFVELGQDGQWKTYCGSFSDHANAIARRDMLKDKYGIDAFIP